MEQARKKTPSDTTDLEREQLRFFLSQGNVAETLAELNPSLAWLPEFARTKVIQSSAQLAPWIERNFDDPAAVREVSANLSFFDEKAADLLEFGLNRQRNTLSPLLAKSWQLIIRHIRSNPRGVLQSDWFDIQPRVNSGEQSSELLERLAQLLRPKPRVGKRISWSDVDGNDSELKRPSDLMSIDYEVDENIAASEVLSAWPTTSTAGADSRLLTTLSDALDASLLDAIDVEVESNTGYGVSDTDVPSVAAHRQNEYRTGFLPIVRVIAEIWTRLAHKNASLALPFVQKWASSPLKLNRRLALFAATDSTVPPNDAADVLLNLPQGLLFLTNSSVEVFRLIRSRWKEFSSAKRDAIEARIVAGPPQDWFRADAGRYVERCRFDVLGEMDRQGLPLGRESRSELQGISKSHPDWVLRPMEQAGFHIWHESGERDSGDPQKLRDVPVESLVDQARAAAEASDFKEATDWQALCQSDPQRALGGLEAKAHKDEWPDWAWNPFLWAASKLDGPLSVELTAHLLLMCPDEGFSKIASTAAWWLNEKTKSLDGSLLWQLWDKIQAVTASMSIEAEARDSTSEALNSPAGNLAEILIKRIGKADSTEEMPFAIRERLDTLAAAPGRFGRLARIRLATEVSVLFERIPLWTTERLVPLFNWSSHEAVNAWSARKYSHYIGSPELFQLTKAPFLELFKRQEITEEDLRIYGDWLTIIMIANRSRNAGYPISPVEARSALRMSANKVLPSVAHRFAIEMQGAKVDDKMGHWEDIVGPVFRSIWPLDADLQSPNSTSQLVRILLACGAAFPQAGDAIIPFIRPEDPSRHTSIYSISNATDEIYQVAPEKVLELIAAVTGDFPSRSFYGMAKALDRIREQRPGLASTKTFQRLRESLSGA